MLNPIKQAFLKHDLYRIATPRDTALTLEEIANIDTTKIAEKGMKFVYCQTPRRDARHGWYADQGNGYFREGNCGFGKMSKEWGEKHLTEPEVYIPPETNKEKENIKTIKKAAQALWNYLQDPIFTGVVGVGVQVSENKILVYLPKDIEGIPNTWQCFLVEKIVSGLITRYDQKTP